MRAPSRQDRLLAALAGTLLLAAGAGAAPKAELWERWSAHDEGSAATVDHSPWDRFLANHLVERDGIRLVRYADVTEADREGLREYLGALEGVDVGALGRAEQLAYWINLYNAQTVDLILENHPVGSIRDIKDGLFSAGPWDREVLTIGGEAVTLNDIEHRILRPIWKDPRIHYAVNCASIGCPNLAAEAYTASNAEGLLDRGAREYVNHPRGARVEDGRLEVSSIYAWFAEDFGGDDAGVIAHLRRYAGPGLRERLEGIDRISSDSYDWSLNEP